MAGQDGSFLLFAVLSWSCRCGVGAGVGVGVGAGVDKQIPFAVTHDDIQVWWAGQQLRIGTLSHTHSNFILSHCIMDLFLLVFDKGKHLHLNKKFQSWE